MSELDLLRSLGDQIVPPPFPKLRETARRRTRRTAGVAIIAAAAAVVTVAAGVDLAANKPHSAPPIDEPQQSDARPLTYAEGATVHYGDLEVAMPGRVVELDVTDDGVAVRTSDDRIWFTDGSAPEQVGAVGESAWTDVLWNNYVGRMVSGNSGSLVAWYEFLDPHSPEVVVYDTHEGQVVHRYPVDMPSGTVGGLYAVDSESVFGFTDLTYGEALSPNWRIDLATGTQRAESQYGRYLRSGSAARMLLVSHQKAADASSFAPFDGVQQFVVAGTRVEAGGEQPVSVLDGLTRNEFTFSAPADYPDTNPVWLVQWLDDDTVVMHADQGDRADLLECHVSTGECAVAVQVPSEAIVPEIADPSAPKETSD